MPVTHLARRRSGFAVRSWTRGNFRPGLRKLDRHVAPLARRLCLLTKAPLGRSDNPGASLWLDPLKAYALEHRVAGGVTSAPRLHSLSHGRFSNDSGDGSDYLQGVDATKVSRARYP